MNEELVDTHNIESIAILVGETPQDINELCLKLCKDYLNDIWSEKSVENIKVKRISGGLSNMMFRCTIEECQESGHTNDVALRLFGKEILSNECEQQLKRHNDAVVSLLMSERGLSPTLYGSFPSGQILQFVKHRHFRREEQNDERLVSELARKLARLHSMSVPINRNPKWVFDKINKNVKIGYNKFPINEMIKEFNLSFNSDELDHELKWIERTIIKMKCPICFSHNDFRGQNILVTNGFDMNCNSDEYILFCDFEASGYGYRGSDFGTLFAEWNRKDRTYSELQDFPEDMKIKSFIDEYIKESINIYGEHYITDKRNTFDAILKEVKVFTLLSYIFMLSACLAIEDYKQMNISKKSLMLGADIHFRNYKQLKNRFIEDKTLIL